MSRGSFSCFGHASSFRSGFESVLSHCTRDVNVGARERRSVCENVFRNFLILLFFYLFIYFLIFWNPPGKKGGSRMIGFTSLSLSVLHLGVVGGGGGGGGCCFRTRTRKEGGKWGSK